MKPLVCLFCVTVVTATLGSSVVLANDEPDLRTLDVPNVVRICESPELLQLLNLNDSQTETLNDAVAVWKSEYISALHDIESPLEGKGRRRPIASGREDNGLGNAISDLLDDDQHQLFRQMTTLWQQSPVQSGQAFQFDLGLSKKQHIQLHELESNWILRALQEVPCDYRFPRHTEMRDRSQWGKRLKYGYAIARCAWKFIPTRNAEWNRILTPTQAKRWKERELQWAFQATRFEILVVDFSSSRKDGKELRTGTWLDYTVPYYTPPFEALQWSDAQLVRIKELVNGIRANAGDLPSDRSERIQWLQAHRKQELECWRQIEALMTREQRATWWRLIGEPAEFGLRELKALGQSAIEQKDKKTEPSEDNR